MPHYEKGPGTKFPHMGNGAFFYGGLDTLEKLPAKYQFYYIFFPQTMIFNVQHLDYIQNLAASLLEEN